MGAFDWKLATDLDPAKVSAFLLPQTSGPTASTPVDTSNIGETEKRICRGEIGSAVRLAVTPGGTAVNIQFSKLQLETPYRVVICSRRKDTSSKEVEVRAVDLFTPKGACSAAVSGFSTTRMGCKDDASNITYSAPIKVMGSDAEKHCSDLREGDATGWHISDPTQLYWLFVDQNTGKTLERNGDIGKAMNRGADKAIEIPIPPNEDGWVFHGQTTISPGMGTLCWRPKDGQADCTRRPAPNVRSAKLTDSFWIICLRNAT